MSAGMIMELRPCNYYPSLSPFPRWVIRRHLTQSTPPRGTSTRAGVWTEGQTSMQSVGSAGESFKFSHHAVDTRPHSELTGSVCPIPPKKGSKRQQNPDSQKASASGAHCATSNNCLHAFTMGGKDHVSRNVLLNRGWDPWPEQPGKVYRNLEQIPYFWFMLVIPVSLSRNCGLMSQISFESLLLDSLVCSQNTRT